MSTVCVGFVPSGSYWFQKDVEARWLSPAHFKPRLHQPQSCQVWNYQALLCDLHGDTRIHGNVIVFHASSPTWPEATLAFW